MVLLKNQYLKVMKTIEHIVLVLAVMVAMVSCGGRQSEGANSGDERTDTTGVAIISFSQLEHDFGKIDEGSQVGCIFQYTNTGTADLVVNAAITSCGCTASKYDVKPIPPGGKGSIEILFDASGRNGAQSKVITVKSNAETPVVMLKILAEVINNDN